MWGKGPHVVGGRGVILSKQKNIYYPFQMGNSYKYIDLNSIFIYGQSSTYLIFIVAV